MSHFPQSKKNDLIEQGPNIFIEIFYEKGMVQSINFSCDPFSGEGMKWLFFSSQRDEYLEFLIKKWFIEYANKRSSSIRIPLNLEFLPPFTQKVLMSIDAVPFGETCTYGEIAKRLGSPLSSRSVGGACGRNPYPFFIPCHRILGAGNQLVGYSAGSISVKSYLLQFEKSGAR